jgi:molybdopterin converting factor subunit 1
MRVTVLMFAQYRDLAGTGETEVEVPERATAAAAVARLRARGSGFARLPATPAVAVNQEYVALETVLRDGDELALLPPLAGG